MAYELQRSELKRGINEFAASKCASNTARGNDPMIDSYACILAASTTL